MLHYLEKKKNELENKYPDYNYVKTSCCH